MTNYWRLERDIEIVQGKTWISKFFWKDAVDKEGNGLHSSRYAYCPPVNSDPAPSPGRKVAPPPFVSMTPFRKAM